MSINTNKTSIIISCILVLGLAISISKNISTDNSKVLQKCDARLVELNLAWLEALTYLRNN